MIENGKRRPSPEVLAFLAERLGTTEDYLLTGRDPGIETSLHLETEQLRVAVHQGRATDVLDRLGEIVDTARRADLTDVESTALEVKAAAQQKLGRFEDAIETFDAAAELRSSSPIEHQVTARCGRARNLFLMGEGHYAVHVLEILLTELRTRPAPDPTALAHVYAALVGPYVKSGLLVEAREAVESAQRLLPRISDPDVIGCMHINVAGVHLTDGLIDAANRALTRAEECFRQLEWLDELATTRIAQAFAYIEKEEWVEARTHLLGALETLDQMPDPVAKSTALNQLGRVERTLGNVEEARRHLTEALELVAESNLNERGFAQRELGLCALDDGNPDEAKRLLLAALDSYRSSSNTLQIGVTFKALGDLEAEYGDESASKALYREGLETATAAAQ